MPYSESHSARQHDPDRYTSFAFDTPEGTPVGISFVLGIKEGKSEVQSVRFAADKWTAEEAKKWLAAHDFTSASFEAATGSSAKKDSLAHRSDRSQVGKITKLDNGFLKIESAMLTRTGVLIYDMGGEIVREFRPQEEVFNVDSLGTLRLAPMTKRHPPQWVDSSNYREYAVGTIGENVARNGKFIEASVMLTDKDGIDFVENSGHRELSCGYTCELDFSPGEIDGEKYDAIQRNIRYNHVALVEKGRAGPEVKLNMDEENPKMKINLDGIDFECAEPLAQAISKLQNAASEQLVRLKTDAETLQAKVDVLAKEVEAEKKLRTEDSSKTPAIVRARIDLEKQASAILEDLKLDSLSDLEVRKAAIAKCRPELNLDEKSEAYIMAAYDMVIHAGQEKNDQLNDVREGLADTGKNDSADELRVKAMRRDSELWKQPLTANKKNGGRNDLMDLN